MPVIGFLHVALPGAFPHLLAGFRQGLKDAGVIEGQNATIEYRWAEGRYDRLPALAAELVRQRVSVFVAVGGETPPWRPRLRPRRSPSCFSSRAIPRKPA